MWFWPSGSYEDLADPRLGVRLRNSPSGNSLRHQDHHISRGQNQAIQKSSASLHKNRAGNGLHDRQLQGGWGLEGDRPSETGADLAPERGMFKELALAMHAKESPRARAEERLLPALLCPAICEA